MNNSQIFNRLFCIPIKSQTDYVGIEPQHKDFNILSATEPNFKDYWRAYVRVSSYHEIFELEKQYE